ncbi:uncharacterized protein L969DRAFT_23855 [Mixia osmundae IAM 14324]|uniref:uncharacterized protein n=1 Tax=Mixia osmundae (strain CBS 9802 / IAM 14324 / JCM 22182 / KY 12970) TaxID=764103 RepID=UPI0004A54A53|nr:uncharacterized protein L969DRAFT_23855 [Mixia osmundae IAM 14324]KEI39410.1 hypothetical protein L969DRAFT_23855 [Mixia osmundae IAM 14324]
MPVESQHRHEQALSTVLELFQSLTSDEVAAQLTGVPVLPPLHDEASHSSRSTRSTLTGSLERLTPAPEQWTFHGLQHGVRIYSQGREDRSRTGATSTRLEGDEGYSSSASGSPVRRPMRIDTSPERQRPPWLSPTNSDSRSPRLERPAQSSPALPVFVAKPNNDPTTTAFFRGEGFIPGRWKPEDVSATIESFGARAQWDPRFNSSTAYVVERLSSCDRLSYARLKSAFPVGDRDACIAGRYHEAIKDKLAYMCVTSVEDPLLPPTEVVRSTIHLNCWKLRYVDDLPRVTPLSLDDTSVEPQAPALSMITPRPPNTRGPSDLYRTVSTHSQDESPVTLSAMPNAQPQRSSPRSKRMPDQPQPTRKMSHVISQEKIFQPLLYNIPNRLSGPMAPGSVSQQSTEETESAMPGLWVSFISRSSPGGAVPESYYNMLQLSLPLSISCLRNHLQTYGFAPHLVRPQLPHLDCRVLNESFDPASGCYELIYLSTHKADTLPTAANETRIRFFGNAFSKGRFDITVLHAQSWKLEFDIPALNGAKTVGYDGQVQTGAGSTVRKTRPSLTQRFSSAALTSSHPSPQAPRTATISENEESTDLSQLPGSCGACTLVIANDSMSAMPVQVRIDKRPEKAKLTSSSLRKVSEALAEASLAPLPSLTAYEDIASGTDSIINHGSALELLSADINVRRRAAARMALHSAEEVIQRLANSRDAFAPDPVSLIPATGDRWSTSPTVFHAA